MSDAAPRVVCVPGRCPPSEAALSPGFRAFNEHFVRADVGGTPVALAFDLCTLVKRLSKTHGLSHGATEETRSIGCTGNKGLATVARIPPRLVAFVERDRSWQVLKTTGRYRPISEAARPHEG